MPFPIRVVEEAWRSAGGRCQCRGVCTDIGMLGATNYWFGGTEAGWSGVNGKRIIAIELNLVALILFPIARFFAGIVIGKPSKSLLPNSNDAIQNVENARLFLEKVQSLLNVNKES